MGATLKSSTLLVTGVGTGVGRFGCIVSPDSEATALAGLLAARISHKGKLRGTRLSDTISLRISSLTSPFSPLST
jgi:hypothetical protein